MACAIGSANNSVAPIPAQLLPYRQYFAALSATFDFSGGGSNSVLLNTLPMPFNTSNASLAVWKQILVSSLSDYTITNVGFAIDPVAGTPLNAVLTYPNGTLVLSPYNYCMLGGPAPSWIVDPKNPNLAQGVQLTLAQTFTYWENATGINPDGSVKQIGPVAIKTERKTVSVYAFSIPGGVFSQEALGEQIPFGLAEFIYNIERVPQYQGSFTVQEVDVTDVCPMGMNLNISGWLPEYASMNAQVQQIHYDLLAGTTELTFGPAKHLGPDDYIQRIRLNRGPRWLYEIGQSSVANQNPGTSGATQLKDTQNAATQNPFLWQPIEGNATVDTTGTPVGLVTDMTTPGAVTAPPAGIPTPPGGQVILNTGPATGPVPVTAPATTRMKPSEWAVFKWTGTTPTSANPSKTFMSLSLDDLNTILAGVTLQGDGATPFTIKSIRIQALQTCDGTNTARLFVCSDAFTIPASWGTAPAWASTPLAAPQTWYPKTT
jgi:hypothetical protein